MYSTHNEGKSIVAERFIKTLKTKHRSFHTKWFKMFQAWTCSSQNLIRIFQVVIIHKS